MDIIVTHQMKPAELQSGPHAVFSTLRNSLLRMPRRGDAVQRAWAKRVPAILDSVIEGQMRAGSRSKPHARAGLRAGALSVMLCIRPSPGALRMSLLLSAPRRGRQRRTGQPHRHRAHVRILQADEG